MEDIAMLERMVCALIGGGCFWITHYVVRRVIDVSAARRRKREGLRADVDMLMGDYHRRMSEEFHAKASRPRTLDNTQETDQ